MELLAYAREFWMLHSAPMTEDDVPLYMLWSQVFMTSETKDWLTWNPTYVASHGVEIPEQMIWAVVHSHNALFDTVLSAGLSSSARKIRRRAQGQGSAEPHTGCSDTWQLE